MNDASSETGSIETLTGWLREFSSRQLHTEQVLLNTIATRLETASRAMAWIAAQRTLEEICADMGVEYKGGDENPYDACIRASRELLGVEGKIVT
ncbi:MAG: hypothetical protein DI537_14085 [Stutzerimonas stutzeri]|nr:MAG: hypothetical protein DI537_14085 [Stutzerimonas stutzeri]